MSPFNGHLIPYHSYLIHLLFIYFILLTFFLVIPKETPEMNDAGESTVSPFSFDFDFYLDHPNMSPLDLDIIMLTAQFTARNGVAFQVGLWNREAKNAQFSFLQSVHPYHGFYLKLVEGYKKVLLPKDDIQEVLSLSKQKDVIIKDIRENAEMMRKKSLEEDEKRKKEEIVLSSQIEWDDFNVVECIEFTEEEKTRDDLLPAPVDQSQLMDIYVLSKEKEIEMKMKEDEPDKKVPLVDKKETEEPVSKVQQPEKPQPVPTGTGKKTDLVQRCPICSQYIPVDELDEHMKIELSRSNLNIDTHRRQEVRHAPQPTGGEMAASLAKFAKKRSDLFGDDDLHEIGKEDEEEQKKRKEKVIWDGHSSSIQRTAKEVHGDGMVGQRAAIHASKGRYVEDSSIGPRFDGNQQHQQGYGQYPPPPPHMYHQMQPPPMGYMPQQYMHPSMGHPPMMQPPHQYMYPMHQQPQEQQKSQQQQQQNKRQKKE